MATKGTMEKGAEKKQEITDGAAISNMSRAQYNDQLETHQTLLQAKNSELTRLTDMLRSVREAKEPLAKVKATLQTEITEANKAINAKTEEVTLIKQKLRYHSVKQITENIERLEYQLRNNNYKPREEQKILDEISMLQRSTKTLREYEAKQAENKKYRAERARLIDERNSNYSKVRALYVQEDEIKKAMAELRGIISNSKKSVEQLRQIKPSLEKNWVTNQNQQQPARNKRYEEKRRRRQEQPRPRDYQETRRVWDKYEVLKEPYEEECDMCRVLITYLQSSMNLATPTSQISSPCISRLTPTTPSEIPNTPASDPDYVGSFYLKPKDEDGFTRVSKREKAKAKREHRLAKRVKDLPHTPDVLIKFSKLSISPPKNTDEVPATVIALQDSLQHYNVLFLEAKKNNGKEKESNSKDTENFKCSRPTSLAITPPQLLVTTTDTHTPSMAASTPISIQSESVAKVLVEGQCPNLATGTNVSPLTGQNVQSPKMPLGLNLTSPTMSWAAAVASSKCTNPETNSLLHEAPIVQNVPVKEIVCNGAHSPEVVNETPKFTIASLSDKREDNKRCNGIRTLGNNESFFSSSISYPNLVEVNNNAARSYANVTAKIKATAVEF